MSRARILADYVAGGTTAAEFDYMDGVTSNVQTQMNAKATKVELDATRQDITVLALREAITENRVAYTSTNSFIDTFEDSTGVGTFTTTTRDDSGEFVATNSVATYGLNSNTKILLHMDDTGLDDS